jgi:hypothetical protein
MQVRGTHYEPQQSSIFGMDYINNKLKVWGFHPHHNSLHRSVSDFST